MIRKRPDQQEARYGVEKNSVDVAMTYLVCDAIAEYPQVVGMAEQLIAYHLIHTHNEPKTLSLTQASQAKIDSQIAWDETLKHHAAHGVDTDRPQYKNPEAPESNMIHTRNPEWLANFVQNFLNTGVNSALRTIRFVTGQDKLTFEQADILLQKEAIQKLVLKQMERFHSQIQNEAKDHRERTRERSHQKFGDLRDEYKRFLDSKRK